jgi:hypothetical protein
MATFTPDIGKSTRWEKGQPSPNPGGRPRTAVLSAALRTKLAQVKPDDAQGRTFAEVVASNLVELACSQNRNAVGAISEILNRCEGKVTQGLTIADVTADLQSKSDEDLQFYVEHGHWPGDDDSWIEAGER